MSKPNSLKYLLFCKTCGSGYDATPSVVLTNEESSVLDRVNTILDYWIEGYEVDERLASWADAVKRMKEDINLGALDFQRNENPPT